MIPLIGLMVWTMLFLGVAYLSWKTISSHLKIYLLILYNAAFLIGILWFFPLLKQIH